MNFKSIIPAAGKGTRMNPVTKVLAKEMLPLGGKSNFKPFIHYVVDESIKSGIPDILVITRPGKQSIQHYFDIVGVEGIHYKNQRDQKGLGDAVLQAEAFVNNHPFAVLLGDDHIDGEVPATKQLITHYKTLPENATLIGVEKMLGEAMTKKGMVIVEHNNNPVKKVTSLIEKPTIDKVVSNLAIIGRYILPPQIFPALKAIKPGHGGEVQLTDAIKKLLDEGHPVFAYEIKGKRIDIGTPITYADAVLYKLLADENSREETIGMIKNRLAEYSSD